MKLVASYAVVLLLVACGAADRAPAEPAQVAPVAAVAADPPAPSSGRFSAFLPAGVYWQGYRTCPGCVQDVQMVAARAKSAEQARELAARVSNLGLPLGYPLIEHGAQIQIAEDLQEDILVIVGILATEAEARALVASLADTELELQVIPAPQDGAGQGVGQLVTLMPGPGTVPAYRRDDVNDKRSGSFELYFTGDPKAARAKLAAVEPVCQIDRDQVFEVSRKKIDWYRWVPVRCGQELAFVDWRETRTMATFFTDPNGKRRLRQVVLVECDVPTILEWPVNERGHKQGKGREVLRSKGC